MSVSARSSGDVAFSITSIKDTVSCAATLCEETVMPTTARQPELNLQAEVS